MTNNKLLRSGKIFSGIIAFVLAITTMAYAAEFSADIKLKNPQGEFDGKAYVKGMKIRHDYTKGGQKETVIYRMDKGVTWIFQPNSMTYIEMPSLGGNYSDPEFEETVKKMAEKIDLGEEMLNGYLCDKYEYKYYNPSSGSLFMWHAKELDYPIKVDYKAPSFPMYTEYKNIKEGGVSDSLFEIPSGYTKMPGF